MNDRTVIGAFGEDAASRLSGLSLAQLRMWDRSGFLKPSFASADRHQPYSRIYSFRDVVSLRVLGQLRNRLKVPMQELRRVSKALADLGESKWTSTTLYVLGKRVVFDDPRTNERKEVVSGQRVFDVPLRAAISDTREAIAKLNVRDHSQVGRVVRAKFVGQNEPVVQGTRIPISAILRYLEAKFSPEQIVAEYPSLTLNDVLAVQNLPSGSNVA